MYHTIQKYKTNNNSREGLCIMATIIDPSISYIINNNLAQYHDLFMECCHHAAEFPKGAILSRSGDPIPYMYFMLEGMVKVYTMNPSGYVRILGYHKTNTLFAMDGICGEQEPAVVTVESITPVKVLLVNWDDIVEMGNRDHSFPGALLRYYGTVFRLMCFDAETKSICDASARLAAFLCLYEKNIKENGVIRLTQDELASAVNASRVQIARICSDFKKQGLISCSRGSVTVLDYDGLVKLSQYK